MPIHEVLASHIGGQTSASKGAQSSAAGSSNEAKVEESSSSSSPTAVSNIKNKDKNGTSNGTSSNGDSSSNGESHDGKLECEEKIESETKVASSPKASGKNASPATKTEDTKSLTNGDSDHSSDEGSGSTNGAAEKKELVVEGRRIVPTTLNSKSTFKDDEDESPAYIGKLLLPMTNTVLFSKLMQSY